MAQTMRPRRPTPSELAERFRAKTGMKTPTESKIYKNSTASPVTAVPEFAPMGGVLISYPGPVPPATNEEQLPPTGPRSLGTCICARRRRSG